MISLARRRVRFSRIGLFFYLLAVFEELKKELEEEKALAKGGGGGIRWRRVSILRGKKKKLE